MAVLNVSGARIMTGLAAIPVQLADPGEGGGRVRVWVETAELAAADPGSTILLARIPSNARILGASRIFWDDLASAGAPAADLGVFNPPGFSGIADDPDALNDSFVLSAAGSAAVVKDIAGYGRRLWEHVAAQAADPRHDLEIRLTTKTAATDIPGTVTLELYYALD